MSRPVKMRITLVTVEKPEFAKTSLQERSQSKWVFSAVLAYSDFGALFFDHSC